MQIKVRPRTTALWVLISL